MSKALLAALMVFCVLAGSEGIGKGAEVLAAAVRPDSYVKEPNDFGEE